MSLIPLHLFFQKFPIISAVLTRKGKKVTTRCRPPKMTKLLFRTMQRLDRDVVLVGRTVDLGKPRWVVKLGWGGNGEGTGRGRSVYEKPGAKVDGIAPHKRRHSN
jgi:hypothetical protein